MIKVYWKLLSRGILYNIQIPHFIIQSVSFLRGGNKRFKRRAKSIFFHTFLVDMEETDLDVIGLPNFEITEKEFVRWLGMLGMNNVKRIEDLSWLLKLKREYESRLVRSYIRRK